MPLSTGIEGKALHKEQPSVGNEAGDIVSWLKNDFQLGHGHAMAIYALLKGLKNEDSP